MTQHTIHKPLARAEVVSVEPGATIAFSFDPSAVTFERFEADLALSFDNGNRVTLTNFFTADAESGLPTLLLEDGKEISSADFLRSFDQSFDISTAAGPAVRSNYSGGSGEYLADSGALINGVDRLGSLGTDQWTGERSVQGAFAGASSNGPDNADNSGTDGSPGQNQNPPVPASPDAYHTRIVVDSSQSGTLRVSVFDADGNPVTDSSAIGSCRFGNGLYFNPPTVDPATGELVFTLTAAGLQALESGVRFEDVMYITVNGAEYPMHMVGNSGHGNYDVTDQEPASGLPGPLHAEWFTHESGDMLEEKNVNLGGGAYNQAEVVVDKSRGTASGMGNTNISLADNVEGKVHVAARTDDGSAYGVRVAAFEADAESTIAAGSRGDVFIEAKSGNATAMGLVTQSGKDENGALYASEATVSGRDISFTTEADQRTAAGIWASGASVVNVEAQGDVTFSSTSTGGTVNYLTAAAYAADSSTVNISGRNVGAESYSLAGEGADGVVMSTGFRTTAGTKMNINTADDGLFSVSTYQELSPYDSPYSGVSWSGGRAAGFTSIGVSASGNVNQWGQGVRSSLNVNAGDVEIRSSVEAASGKGTATGVYAGYGGDVSINTSDLDNSLTIRGDAPSWGVGVFSTNNGTTKINTGKGDDTLNIGGSAHNGAAAVGLAAQAGGSTVIDGGEGSDTLTVSTVFTGDHTLGTDYMDTAGGAFGMNSAWGYASNVIRNVENVTITADASESASGWAYGMFTRDGWGYTVKNIIENTDSPLTVLITAKAGAAGQAYAMYGVAGGHNLIQGGSREGDLHGDSVTLNGNVGGWNNLNEVRTGSGNDRIEINGNLTGGNNAFGMGSGDDRFILNGDVTGGSNSINMGAGDDLVTLNGKVTGALSITGGDGYDILVLQADSFAEFSARYDSWLKGSLGAIQVENIQVHINGLSPEDQAALENYFGDSRFDGYEVGYSGGETAFAAPFAGLEAAALHLGDLLDIGGEEIDFHLPSSDDGHPYATNAPELLNTLFPDHASAAGETGNDTSPAYAADNAQAEYTHSSPETDAMLAQHEIISAFGG